MPLFEYACRDCGGQFELLIVGSSEKPVCPDCGSKKLSKLMSASSSASGLGDRGGLPGPNDTACCGSAPGAAAGCAGPGSCCGKAH